MMRVPVRVAVCDDDEESSRVPRVLHVHVLSHTILPVPCAFCSPHLHMKCKLI